MQTALLVVRVVVTCQNLTRLAVRTYALLLQASYLWLERVEFYRLIVCSVEEGICLINTATNWIFEDQSSWEFQ